ncbi:MAG TPA: TadE/TadG family type IV pilus assembly protein, partial [Terriglobia bacterium]|nr:TadE/TadG family type IV pilus assembly protein [Terriglobia bacterium]
MCHSPGTRVKRFCARLVTKLKEESGAELFEAALVLPMLLILLLGILTFGRAYNTYQTITRAAREGAKAAVLTPCADSTYCTGATNYSADDIWNNFVDPVLQADNLDTTKVTGKSLTYVQLDPNGSPAHVCGVQL